MKPFPLTLTNDNCEGDDTYADHNKVIILSTDVQRGTNLRHSLAVCLEFPPCHVLLHLTKFLEDINACYLKFKKYELNVLDHRCYGPSMRISSTYQKIEGSFQDGIHVALKHKKIVWTDIRIAERCDQIRFVWRNDGDIICDNNTSFADELGDKPFFVFDVWDVIQAANGMSGLLIKSVRMLDKFPFINSARSLPDGPGVGFHHLCALADSMGDYLDLVQWDEDYSLDVIFVWELAKHAYGSWPPHNVDVLSTLQTITDEQSDEAIKAMALKLSNQEEKQREGRSHGSHKGKSGAGVTAATINTTNQEEKRGRSRGSRKRKSVAGVAAATIDRTFTYHSNEDMPPRKKQRRK